MDELAPITWLIAQINQIVTAGAAAGATQITDKVAPLASVCFGIYIILVCVNYLRGAESEPVMDFGMRMASFAVVIGLGLSASTYVDTIIPIVTGIGPSVAKAISGGAVSAGTMDDLGLIYFGIISNGFDAVMELEGFDFLAALPIYGIKAALLFLGILPFFVIATLLLIVADVGSVIVAILGPIFFAFALFPATRQYFSAWVNTALSYALMPIIIAVITVIAVSISQKMIGTTSKLEDVPLKTIFFASIGNLVLLGLLAQVSSLASSLSAGGINAGIPGGAGGVFSLVKGFAGVSAKGMRGGARALGSAGRFGGKAAAYGYLSGRSVIDRVRNINSIRKAG